jgi:hypothetical protein
VPHLREHGIADSGIGHSRVGDCRGVKVVRLLEFFLEVLSEKSGGMHQSKTQSCVLEKGDFPYFATLLLLYWCRSCSEK